MSETFKPSLNYWSGTGTQIRPKGDPQPSNALNKSSLVLLVHGYNNKLQAASDSYTLFKGLQQNSGSLNANILGIYWPGANWAGPLYYMQAVEQAQLVAPLLAADLVQAAKQRGYLYVDFVAHSLGCRLVLEVVKNLLAIKSREGSLSGLSVGKIVFMAGAVPVKYLEDINNLQQALKYFAGTMSLYSEADIVLKFAFPAGQTAAGEGFFPVALGHRHYAGGSLILPGMIQRRYNNAGHSDYWGGRKDPDPNDMIPATVAEQFLSLTPPSARTTEVYLATPKRERPVRETTAGRVIASRSM